MQAITTKYVGPTDTKPARIIAETGSGRRRIVSRHAYDEKNEMDLHANAARMLCAQLGWKGVLAGGGTKDGYAFVFVQDDGVDQFKVGA